MLLDKFCIFIYQIVIRCYGVLLWLVAPFQSKAKLWVQGRKNLFALLSIAFRNEKTPIIWMHCASLGEFEQGRPIIESLKKDHPNYKILLTFYSPSGFEIRKNYPLADFIFYMPLDTFSKASKFISITKPKMAIFVKYEFWYFHLLVLQNQKIPTYLIAGVFNENQYFFKDYGKWLLKVIAGFDKLLLQDAASLKLIENRGLTNGLVVGDPRIDRVGALSKNLLPIPIIKAFKKGKKLFILGSTHTKDEQLFWTFLIAFQSQKNLKNWRFLLAPHEVEEPNIQNIIRSCPVPTMRFSKIKKVNVEITPPVLILDTIGLLATVYQYGDICYIGGGFNKSIHNILEPAAFGLPIIFGPNYQQFKEANELLSLGGAYSINTVVELKEIFDKLAYSENGRIAGNICQQYIGTNLGATKKIMTNLDLV